MSTALVLDLIEGCELVMNGPAVAVERLEPYWGKVVLARPATRAGSPADHDRRADAPPGLPCLDQVDARGSSRRPGAPARYVERPE